MTSTSWPPKWVACILHYNYYVLSTKTGRERQIDRDRVNFIRQFDWDMGFQILG